MYNFFIDTIVWSFAIYGFLKFMGEFVWQFFSYIAVFFINVNSFMKKFIAKFSR